MSNTDSSADKLSNVQNYSINLLWVNNNAKDQAYIYDTNTQDELVAKFLLPALHWAAENPTADVNIWYDSTLHEPHSILNTQKVLDEHNVGCSNIKLRDIRSIKVVNDNAVLFSANMPLYYRIDFLKMIICLHELKNEMKDAVIYSDLDVCDLRENQKRMNKQELFNHESLIKLKEVGILLNSAKLMEPLNPIPENKFIQMVNDEKAILALKYSVNACLMRGMYVLNSMSAQDQEECITGMYNQPYYSTVFEIYRLYKLMKLGTIEVRANFIGNGAGEQWAEYDPDKHGYELLGNVLYYEEEDEEGSAPFVYVNDQAMCIHVKEIFRINPINYNTDDSSLRVRDDTGTRDGNPHDEYGFIPNSDIQYVANFWSEDGLGIIGSNDGYDNINDIQ